MTDLGSHSEGAIDKNQTKGECREGGGALSPPQTYAISSQSLVLKSLPELHREPTVCVTEASLNLWVAGIILFILLPCPQKLYFR